MFHTQPASEYVGGKDLVRQLPVICTCSVRTVLNYVYTPANKNIGSQQIPLYSRNLQFMYFSTV